MLLNFGRVVLHSMQIIISRHEVFEFVRIEHIIVVVIENGKQVPVYRPECLLRNSFLNLASLKFFETFQLGFFAGGLVEQVVLTIVFTARVERKVLLFQSLADKNLDFREERIVRLL